MGRAGECDWLKQGREEQVKAEGQDRQAGMWHSRGRNHGHTTRLGDRHSERKRPGCLRAMAM